MNDPILADSVRAARIFALGTLLLLLGAALDLNFWPMQEKLIALWSFSAKEIFLAFNGSAIPAIILFWGSRPSRSHQWIVLLSWPLCSACLWLALDHQLNFAWGDPQGFDIPMLLCSAMAIPATLLLAVRVLRPIQPSANLVFEKRLRYLILLTILFMLVPISALTLTIKLHPLTYDIYALLWDHSTGLNLTAWLINTFFDWPLVPELLLTAYGFTAIAFLAVAIRDLRGKPLHVAPAILTWVVLTSMALVAYHFFPITGPKYLFGYQNLVSVLTNPYMGLQLAGTGPYPRNGMPSMHFGWVLAATILWCRSDTAWWSRALFIIMTILVAAATLFIGEHYVVDLIVAVPFVLAGIALSTTTLAWSAKPRRYTVLLGLATWGAWILILRTSTAWLITHPWASWLMIFATALVVVLQIRWMRQFPQFASLESRAIDNPLSDQQAVGLERRVGLMFFVSGAAALVYQVLFAKQLALVFGSTATATFTVLATFLGGMAIGSLIGGRLALRVNRPLIVYAFVEMVIAAYCALTPWFFKLIQAAYVALATGHAPEAPELLWLRVLLGATVLLIPTVLMGITLPVLAKTLAGPLQRIGTKVAWLYFANTAGAAVGALMTSYAIIPLLGTSRTTLLAAALNLLVALAAFEIFKRLPAESSTAPTVKTNLASVSKRVGIAALLSLGIGGVLSLGLEVIYVHMLAIVAGNSVYAFGLMLATFLLGLSGGGEAARRLLLKGQHDQSRLLLWSLLGLAISMAAGVWLWNEIPAYFASFAQSPFTQSFKTREAIRGLVCALVMIPPTLFIGAAYTVAMDIATATQHKNPVAMVGIGAACNTLGNIIGVLLFGFVVLPLIGGLAAIRVIAIATFVLAMAVVITAAIKITRRDLALTMASAAIILASFTVHLNYDTLSSGANVYFFAQPWGKVIDHAESIDGGLTTVSQINDGKITVKTLLTNGKFQGNDAWQGEMQAQLGIGLAPLLHQEQRQRALVIGYGTGVTSRVFHEAGFAHLDIAELSHDVVKLANTHFAQVNQSVTSSPNVQLHVTDGRNLLLLTPPQNLYDVISIEISSIWFAGAASLYNREFYQLAHARLQPNGVLQQWMQLHRLTPLDLLSIVASLRAEFRYVSLYVIGGQGILIASNHPEHAAPRATAIAMLENSPQLEKVRGILHKPISTLSAERLLDPDGIDRFIKQVGGDARIWWSTDDNLRLEYSTPKANVNPSTESLQANLQLLGRFSENPVAGK